jgi:hypothetical protein
VGVSGILERKTLIDVKFCSQIPKSASPIKVSSHPAPL